MTQPSRLKAEFRAGVLSADFYIAWISQSRWRLWYLIKRLKVEKTESQLWIILNTKFLNHLRLLAWKTWEKLKGKKNKKIPSSKKNMYHHIRHDARWSNLLTIARLLNFEHYLCRTLGFSELTSRGHFSTLPSGLIIYSLKYHHHFLLTCPLTINLRPWENGGTEISNYQKVTHRHHTLEDFESQFSSF